jgi:hypothetical protein
MLTAPSVIPPKFGGPILCVPFRLFGILFFAAAVAGVWIFVILRVGLPVVVAGAFVPCVHIRESPTIPSTRAILFRFGCPHSAAPCIVNFLQHFLISFVYLVNSL